MGENSPPSVREISRGMAPLRMDPRKERFFDMVPQIERWFEEGYTSQDIRDQFTRRGFPVTRSTFFRHLKEARKQNNDSGLKTSDSPVVEFTPSTAKASRRKTPKKQQPTPPSEVEPLVTRADLQALREKRAAAAAIVPPDPQPVAEGETPPTVRPVFTRALLRPVKGFKAPSLGEFTPRPAMKLEDI